MPTETHTHTHDGHTHSHTPEARLDPNVAARPSVLELGATVGAAVIYTPAALNGAEIEIKPRDAEWNGAHTAVRLRPTGQGSAPLYAALYFGLAEGTYDLRLGKDRRTIEVFGGAVTEETW